MSTPKQQKAGPAKKKVFIVDDHPIVRERVAELINQEPDLVVCGEAEDAVQAVKAIAAAARHRHRRHHAEGHVRHRADQAAQGPAPQASDPRAVDARRIDVRRAGLRAGAKGYLTKQEATKKVIDAIRRILRGEIYVSDKLAARSCRRSPAATSSGGSPVDVLTDRELEVFQLLGQGLTVREMPSGCSSARRRSKPTASTSSRS